MLFKLLLNILDVASKDLRGGVLASTLDLELSIVPVDIDFSSQLILELQLLISRVSNIFNVFFVF